MVGPDAAEDVLQEAMVDAYRGLDGFSGNAAVGTWLYRIALNRCLQERRRTKPLVVDAEPLELLARWEDPTTASIPRSWRPAGPTPRCRSRCSISCPRATAPHCCSTTGTERR